METERTKSQHVRFLIAQTLIRQGGMQEAVSDTEEGAGPEPESLSAPAEGTAV